MHESICKASGDLSPCQGVDGSCGSKGTESVAVREVDKKVRDDAHRLSICSTTLRVVMIQELICRGRCRHVGSNRAGTNSRRPPAACSWASSSGLRHQSSASGAQRTRSVCWLTPTFIPSLSRQRYILPFLVCKPAQICQNGWWRS